MFLLFRILFYNAELQTLMKIKSICEHSVIVKIFCCLFIFKTRNKNYKDSNLIC